MEYPIEISDVSGNITTFKGSDDVRKFVDQEWNSWAWVSSVIQRARNNSNNPNQDLNAISINWIAAINRLREFLNNGSIEQTKAVINNLFNQSSMFPISTRPESQAIFSIREKIGDSAGIGATACYLGIRFDGSDSQQVRGVSSMHEYLGAAGDTAPKAIQSSISKLLRQLSDQQVISEEKSDNLDQKILQIQVSRKKRFKRILKEGRAARIKFSNETASDIARIDDAAARSIETLSATQRAFEEQMRLGAPVQYWKIKSKSYRDKSYIAAAIGIVYTIGVLSYAAIYGIHKIISTAEEVSATTTHWEMAYVVIAISVFIGTIIVWIGRLISRFYISQTHLAIDASERATMAETYLALTKNDNISKDERILVLGALFKPSSNGLVKDDGNLEFNVSELLAKLATTKPS